MRPIFVMSEKDAKRVILLKFGWMFWWSFILLMALSSLQIVYIYFLIRRGFDLGSFCYAECCIAYQSMGYFKCIAFGLSSANLNSIFVQLNEMHSKSAMEQFEYKIREKLQQTKRMMIYYSFIQVFMKINFLVIPFYGYIKAFIETGKWEMGLPALFWLPFEVDTNFRFYSAYFVQSILKIIIKYYTSSDIMLLAILQLICAHFDYVQNRLSEINPNENPTSREFEEVKACVIKQNNAIQLILFSRVFRRQHFFMDSFFSLLVRTYGPTYPIQQ